MLAADRTLLVNTMKQHEETVVRMQAQAQNTQAAVLERLDGFLTAAGRGLDAIGAQLDRMAATHESRMLEFAKSLAAGMDQAIEKGRRVQEQFSAEMDALQKNGTRMASTVGDLNRSLALCASMLEQVQDGLADLAAATEARKKLRLGYGQRIARFFGIQEGVRS
jgi:chromosome segregation ATPase